MCNRMNKKKKYSYNRNYFEEIDTPEKAYFLGFIAADGHIRGHNKKSNRPQALAFRISEKDSYILENFIKEIGGEKEQIKQDNRIIRGKMNNARTLEISSVKMANDLIKNGISFKDKSMEQKWIRLSKQLELYYIRGMIDGDGWVSFNKWKDQSFYIDFGLCGSYDVVNNFSQWLRGNFHFKGTVYKKGNFYECRAKSTSYNTVKKVYDKLYSEELNCSLKRKKNNFYNFFNSIYEKHIPQISFNDTGKLAVLVPILGCQQRPHCGYCFNHKTIKNAQMNEDKLIIQCLEYAKDVKCFVFGGNDAIGINSPITIKLSNLLKNLGCYIILQVRNISWKRFNKIREIQPNEIQLTVNDLKSKRNINYTKKLIEEFNVKTKVIYIPTKTEYPKDINIDVVQQFQPGECLDPSYNDIPQPSRDEVMEFARSIGAKEIITKSNGRELVC